jgi:hypothetical protein
VADTRVLNAQPWRFIPGDQCYVHGWPADAHVVITRQIPYQRCPHYYCVCPDGHEWRIPQQHLSRTPIPADG